MSEPPPDAHPPATHPLAERFAEVRGEHGWARYVDDETLAAWLRPARIARDGGGPDDVTPPRR